MFSGDSSGLIIVWSTIVNESSQENLVQQWSIDKVNSKEFTRFLRSRRWGLAGYLATLAALSIGIMAHG